MRQQVELKKILRVVDANFNRAKEGLRVCEDVCRYGFNKQNPTKNLKDIRHALTRALNKTELKTMILSRDVLSDVGRGSVPAESQRADLNDVLYANAQRVKESLRVLEEVIKILNPQSAQSIKILRYKFYEIEKIMVVGS